MTLPNDNQLVFSMEDVLSRIDKTLSEINQVDRDLEELFGERVQLEERMSKLKSFTDDIALVQNKTQTMHKRLQKASTSAQDIASQAGQLNKAQTRVEHVLQRVKLMLDLKETIKQVEQSIDEFKYDAACKEIHRLLHQANKLDLKEADEASYLILLDSKERLQTLVQENCQQALQKNELNVVLEYARLYPYLDLPKEGLELYCEALKREVMGKLENQSLLLNCEAFATMKNNKNEDIPYVSVLEGLIDTVFSVINDSVNVLKQTFGDGSELVLAQVLHTETDREVFNLISHYIQHFELPKLAKFAEAFERAALPKGGLVSRFKDQGNREYFDSLLKQLGMPLKKFDTLLQEISHICSELESFDATMRSVISDAKQMIEQDKSKRLIGLLDTKTSLLLPNETKINTIRHEMIAHYIILEQFNMQVELCRIIEEDNVQNEDQLISSSLELAFFVLRKIALRAFATYDVNAACAVINHISNTLDGLYKEWLDMNLRQQKGQEDKSFAEQFWQHSKKTLYSSSTDLKSSEENKNTIIILNNLDQSISNTCTLKYQLEEEMENTFRDISEKEKFKVRHCLDMLYEISKGFERIVERGIAKYAQSYHSYLESSLERFRNFSYVITEQQFSTGTFELNRSAPSNLVVSAASDVVGGSAGGFSSGTNLIPFVDHLEQSFRPHLFALHKQLTSVNYDRMLAHLLHFFTDRLEQIILQQKFTFWGGMQLDKDRQRLEAFFSELGKPRVRDHFSRTRQIVSLLQLTKVEEAKNYLNGNNLMGGSRDSLTTGTATNTLSPDEILKFLRLRVDFTPAQIQKLQER